LAYGEGASIPTVGLGRFGITALVFWGCALVWRRMGGFPLRLPLRTTIALLALGGAIYFLGSLSFFGAVAYIPVSLAGLLLYTYPALATLLAAGVGSERPTPVLGLGV